MNEAVLIAVFCSASTGIESQSANLKVRGGNKATEEAEPLLLEPAPFLLLTLLQHSHCLAFLQPALRTLPAGVGVHFAVSAEFTTAQKVRK